MDIPASAYAALGAVLAALIAGFFSFANLVSAKENKVSEFRQDWINGLRIEISELACSLSELVRLRRNADLFDEKEFLTLSGPTYRQAVQSISRIQLRLNPAHIKNNPDGLDAKFFSVVNSARKSFNEKNYEEALEKVNEIRNAAAPLLKNEWERVKLGEPGYKKIRLVAQITLACAALIFLIGSIVLIWLSLLSAKP